MDDSVFIFIGTFIAILIGAWVYSDARSRDKSTGIAIFWGISTFLLLIVFLPLWLIVRPKKIQEIVFNEKPKLCVNCGKYYEGIPKFCPNCGQFININNSSKDGNINFCSENIDVDFKKKDNIDQIYETEKIHDTKSSKTETFETNNNDFVIIISSGIFLGICCSYITVSLSDVFFNTGRISKIFIFFTILTITIFLSHRVKKINYLRFFHILNILTFCLIAIFEILYGYVFDTKSTISLSEFYSKNYLTAKPINSILIALYPVVISSIFLYLIKKSKKNNLNFDVLSIVYFSFVTSIFLKSLTIIITQEIDRLLLSLNKEIITLFFITPSIFTLFFPIITTIHIIEKNTNIYFRNTFHLFNAVCAVIFIAYGIPQITYNILDQSFLLASISLALTISPFLLYRSLSPTKQ